MPVQINRATFLSVLETSRKLRVTPQTVRNYLKKGELESIRVGRALLIPEKKVHALLSFAK
jgi:excisionase family DNA binding protein